MAHLLLDGQAGERHLLLGNQAIVRGALEAGVQMVTCYPGTPSSEVPDTFFAMSKDGPYKFEYSVNEKVALEVAGGATLAGAMTLCTMKHVGVNVAADPLMTLAYIGAPGGLVLLSADDPGCHSSQNEQDNRSYARLAGLPCFEPSTAQEAKDMTREALLLSRKWQQPVLLRTTTRLNHLRGPVTFGPLPQPTAASGFVKSPMRFVPIPAVARVRHGELLKILAAIAAETIATPWNTIRGQGSLGIIASGMSRAYLNDALVETGLGDNDVSVMEIGFTYPLPEKGLIKFLSGVSRCLVLEEGEPLLETELRALAQKNGINLDIHGKGFSGLTRLGEYTVPVICSAIGKLTGKPPAPATACATAEQTEAAAPLPGRPPNLCAGCPHRAAYYAVRQVYGDSAVYSSDIGCYTLGILPPLSAADFLLCMGSSIPGACGVSRATGQPAVAFIGDSTFFHSGLTGLVNAVFNKHDVLVVILDNRTTAMTGHQPHPGVDVTVHGPREPLSIEAAVRGCGVQEVRTVNPLNIKATLAALEELKGLSGVRVLIATEPCPLHAKRLMGKKPRRTAYAATQDESLTACVQSLACPAFAVDANGARIEEGLCSGCMVCLQLTTSIKAKARE